MRRLRPVREYLRPRGPSLTDRKSSIDPGKCVGCGRCLALCPTDAIAPIEWQAASVFNKKMAEYAAAIVHGKPQFHISLIVDVSPNCDCHAENDVPIVPDIGMLCSTDMVALDQACADLVNAAEPLPNASWPGTSPRIRKERRARIIST